ncbi:MAG: COX15/CtaA family protein [Deltaproteobacteria bacterium]|nr:COX15/CtaA family protein [Deltaproteobacteria bacterium]
MANSQSSFSGARGARKITFAAALTLSLLTVVLLAAGALVTSTGSSLAVPDWPLAYGQVFPPMVGGILFEHGHRLIASLVGLVTLLLAAWLWVKEERGWVKGLGLAALLLVILQGVMGGITVLMQISTPVSITHALTAQLFFMTTIVLAQVTASGWEDMSGNKRPLANNVGTWGMITVLALLVQLVLGATTRHNNAGLAIVDFPLSYGGIVPPLESLESFPVAIHFAHRVGAVVVVTLVLITLFKALRSTDDSRVRTPALVMGVLVVAQFFLGGAIIWTEKSVPVTVLHLVNGALLLGSTWLVTFRARVMGAKSIGGARPFAVFPVH